MDFDPKGVFSFRPDGECRKTRFELNLTIFVNSAFCAAWKSPPKIVVWNRPRGFRSQGCFFRLAPMGKVEKRVLNSISRYSSIPLFALLGKAHPKWWCQTDVVDFDPKGVFSFRPDGESRKTPLELNLKIFVNSAFCAAWKSPPKIVVWSDLVEIDPKGVFSFRPDGESRKTSFKLNFTIFVNSAFCAAWKSPPKIVVWNRRRGFRSQGCFFVSPRCGMSKNAFWTQFDDIRDFGFLRCLEKPTQNCGMKSTSWISIPRVFFSFSPDGESRKTRFELNLTIFVNSAFCAAWKSPPKMVVLNRRRGFRSQGCFFRFATMGKVKNAFWTQFDDIRQFGFLRCLEKPTQNGGMKPTSWISIPKGVFSFRPDGESRKTRFVLNFTIFVNSAFCAAWKSPPKMVVWNRPRGFRSQGCFFVSPGWGKSKNAFWTQFDDIRQFGFLRCLEKPTQNSGMKLTSWISIPRVFFRFAPMGNVEKRVLKSIWRYSLIRLFALLGKGHPKLWYEIDLVDFDPKGVFFVSPRWGKSKNAFWTQFDDIREFGFLRCLQKPTQNGGMKPNSWNSIPRVFFRFAPMGKVEKRVLNSIWRYSSIRLFALLGKAHPK